MLSPKKLSIIDAWFSVSQRLPNSYTICVFSSDWQCLNLLTTFYQQWIVKNKISAKEVNNKHLTFLTSPNFQQYFRHQITHSFCCSLIGCRRHVTAGCQLWLLRCPWEVMLRSTGTLQILSLQLQRHKHSNNSRTKGRCRVVHGNDCIKGHHGNDGSIHWWDTESEDTQGLDVEVWPDTQPQPRSQSR